LTRKHLALAGGVAGDDGQACVEILKNLVRDGEIPVDDERLFEGQPNIVPGDDTREFLLVKPAAKN